MACMAPEFKGYASHVSLDMAVTPDRKNTWDKRLFYLLFRGLQSIVVGEATVEQLGSCQEQVAEVSPSTLEQKIGRQKELGAR